MQILFITVCDTSGTRIRKQLFYFISVITFQQISITFQFGQESLDFLSISSPLTASQQRALLLPSPSMAISHPKLALLVLLQRTCEIAGSHLPISPPNSFIIRHTELQRALAGPLQAHKAQ